MNTAYVKDSKGNDKFEAFELVKLMNRGAQLIDGRFDKRFPLVCAAGMRIKGKINLKKMEKAINNGYRDIDTMRSVLNMDDPDDLYFRILESYEIQLEEKVPEGSDPDERFENAKKEVQYNVFQREYYRDCACPIVLYKLGEDDHFLALAIDHGMADGQAFLLILKKLILDYIGLPGGGKINKRSLLDFYEFFEKFKDNGVMEQNTLYWQKIGEGLDGLYKYNAPLENNSISEDEKLVKIPMSTLKQAGKNYKTTAGNLVIAAYQAALSHVYSTDETAITCISANRSVPEFFDTVVLQLDPMLLRNSIPRDDTEVKDFLKSIMLTTSEGMKHTPSFYSQVTYSRFLFS
ncbi:MAG: condensation domain-containing protein, partial [Ruminococcus sp.]|nr:condensation domain-containing protein [Ruminococcus sp.]